MPHIVTVHATLGFVPNGSCIHNSNGTNTTVTKSGYAVFGRAPFCERKPG